MRNLIKAIVTVSILASSFGAHAGLFSRGPKVKNFACKLTIADNGKTSSVNFKIKTEKDGSNEIKLGKRGKSLGLPAGHEWVEVTLNDAKFFNPIFWFRVRPNVTIMSGSYGTKGNLVDRNIVMSKTYKGHLYKMDRILVNAKSASSITLGKKGSRKITDYSLDCKKIQ